MIRDTLNLVRGAKRKSESNLTRGKTRVVYFTQITHLLAQNNTMP